MQFSQSLPLPGAAMDISRKMSIAALSEADGFSPALSSRSLKQETYLTVPTLPQTPPDSTAGSPAMKSYGKFTRSDDAHSLLKFTDLQPVKSSLHLHSVVRLTLHYLLLWSRQQQAGSPPSTVFQAYMSSTRRFRS